MLTIENVQVFGFQEVERTRDPGCESVGRYRRTSAVWPPLRKKDGHLLGLLYEVRRR